MFFLHFPLQETYNRVGRGMLYEDRVTFAIQLARIYLKGMQRYRGLSLSKSNECIIAKEGTLLSILAYFKFSVSLLMRKSLSCSWEVRKLYWVLVRKLVPKFKGYHHSNSLPWWGWPNTEPLGILYSRLKGTQWVVNPNQTTGTTNNKFWWCLLNNVFGLWRNFSHGWTVPPQNWMLSKFGTRINHSVRFFFQNWFYQYSYWYL